jgi:anti-sigma regulatory factor (Ser/Thr protein kinase)
MFDTLESLSTCYPAVVESVPQVRHRLAALAASAGASDELLDRVRLAVSEVVTNAVEHAYRSRAGDIQVTAAMVGDTLSVLVADDGCGLGGSHASRGLGIGLAVAAQMSDDFTVASRSSGGVEVRMGFMLSAADAGCPPLRASRIAR